VRKAIICLPPQSGKTAGVSEDFPAYCIGRDPKLSLVGCAYNSDRASDYGEAVRDQVKSPEFKILFPKVIMSEDSQAKNRWNVTTDERKRGGYFAAGVGTALTGRKGDIMMIDDPFKDREDADSEIQREKVWRWYHSVFRTRLSPDGVIIIVCTRWHDSDLVGRLLEEQDDWELLSIPCEATENDPLGREKGEFLSEAPGGARYSKEDYETLKREMPPFEWASLFQQDPTPDDGMLFKKESFLTHTQTPWGSRSYVCADLSYSDKQTSDPAVITKWEIDSQGTWYCDDLWRERAMPDVTATVLAQFCLDHNPTELLLEKVDENFGGALIRRVFDEMKVRTPIVTLSAAGDKVQKATSYRAQVSRGKVSIKEAPWAEAFIAEHLRFPNGKNDDMVDNGSLLGRRMDQLRQGSTKISMMKYGPHTGQNIIESLNTTKILKTRFA
jgi:predicted phage terminase large subunit-like protein